MSIRSVSKSGRKLSRSHRKAISKGLLAFWRGQGHKETASAAVVPFKPRRLKPIRQETPATVHETPELRRQRFDHALGHPAGTFDPSKAQPAHHVVKPARKPRWIDKYLSAPLPHKK